MEEKPMEENLTQENQTETKKRRGWLIPAVIAAVVVVVAIGAAVFFLTRPVIPDPYAAAREAVDGLPSLPNPATLGVLGQGEVDGTHFGVSGNLNLQADEGGLALSLTDFTLGYEEGSTDLEVYINKNAAAIRLPGLTGEAWYGIAFLEGLQVQADRVIDQALLDWYFKAGQLEELRQTIDDLRVDLGSVHDLDGSEETDWLKRAIADLPAEAKKTESGFELTFDATGRTVLTAADLPSVYAPLGQMPTDAPRITTILLRLDPQKRLTALELAFEQGGAQGSCLLDLGDPAEPSPRLELEWGEGNRLELAFTVAEGEAVVMPEFENAFSLLAILAAAVEP